MSERVAITGCGLLSAWGAGLDPFARALAGGRPAFRMVDSHPLLPHQRPRPYAAVDESEISRWVAPRIARRMSRPSKLAMAASAMALEDAGLPARFADDAVTATVIATAFGTAAFAEELVSAILIDPQSASPFHFSESVANAPAAQVAIAHRAVGTNVAITQREAGPCLALAAGLREVQLGRASQALVGAVDEIHPLVHAALSGFHAVAGLDSGGLPTNLPFDRRRTGVLPAEGAVVLVLETEASARGRGRRPLAVVRAAGRAFDATATPWSWGHDAAGLARQIRRSLARADLDPADLGGWVASAAGSRAGDALEAALLCELYPAPSERPPVLAPKRVVGEFAGMGLAAAVALAAGARLGLPDRLEPLDDRIELGEATRPGPVLSLALAAGGAAAWVVLEPS